MRFLHDLLQDVQYAGRGLRRTPGVAAAAVLSLALGIGANTAIFAAIDALMLRSLPVAHPEALVVVLRNFAGRGTADAITYPAFEQFRDAGIFDSLAASATVGRSGVRIDNSSAPDARTFQIGLISGNYFSMLGVRASMGRTIAPADDRRDAPPVAVLGASCWHRQFGGAREVIGRTLTIAGTTFTIVGVADAAFTGEDVGVVTDLWTPIAFQSQVMPERPGLLQNPGSSWVRALGRLKPGVSMAQAGAAAKAIFATQPASPSPFGTPRFELGPAGRGFSYQREVLATPLLVLGVIVGLVLLIACANVAMLVLGRAEGRQRELAVRLAIGAGRGRLVRQLITEGLVLAFLAGAAGFAVASWMTRVLTALAASGRARFDIDASPDARMLLVTAGISLVTALICGVWPALRTSRVSLTAALSASRESGSGAAGGRLRGGRVLIVAQAAVSLALLVGAGLLVRTLRNLETEDIGVDRRHVWLFFMAPMEAGRTGETLVPLFTAAQERLSTIPGVESVSPSTDGVLSGFVGLRVVAVEGQVATPGEDSSAQWNIVGPKFFSTIGMPLVAGRDFGSEDTATSRPVAVINETMARRFFGDARPIGRRFGFGRELSKLIEVVGVVKDAKYFSARDRSEPMAFLPYPQDVGHIFRMCVIVRTSSDTPALIDRIRTELAAIDSAVPVSLVTTTSEQLDRTLSQERLVAWLAGAFSVLALILACVGLYGVMSYAVVRRTREIGIRIAIGEMRGSILRRVLRDSLVPVVTGVAIGVPAAVAGMRSVQALLFGVGAADAVTIAVSAGILIAVSAIATVVPARRAAAVDPIVALRAE